MRKVMLLVAMGICATLGACASSQVTVSDTYNRYRGPFAGWKLESLNEDIRTRPLISGHGILVVDERNNYLNVLTTPAGERLPIYKMLWLAVDGKPVRQIDGIRADVNLLQAPDGALWGLFIQWSSFFPSGCKDPRPAPERPHLVRDVPMYWARFEPESRRFLVQYFTFRGSDDQRWYEVLEKDKSLLQNYQIRPDIWDAYRPAFKPLECQ